MKADSERIKELLNYLKVSKNALGVSIGDKNGMRLQHVESGRNSISEKLAKDISNKYSEINYKWLLTGEGNMLNTYKEGNPSQIPANEPQEDIIETKKSIPMVSNNGVPYYDVDFLGGLDNVFNDQSVNPSFYIDFPPYNHCDAWINVSGKSMSPFISHGDIAALKKLSSWQEFIPFGEIYAVYTDEQRTIKIVTEGKDENHFTLRPYNKSPEFVEQQIPKKLIRQMFRVHGSIKKFF